MNVRSNSVVEIMAMLRSNLLGNTQISNNELDEPFRSELYNSEQLENHAQVLSKAHKIHKN